jgi:hypothetical protein
LTFSHSHVNNKMNKILLKWTKLDTIILDKSCIWYVIKTRAINFNFHCSWPHVMSRPMLAKKQGRSIYIYIYIFLPTTKVKVIRIDLLHPLFYFTSRIEINKSICVAHVNREPFDKFNKNPTGGCSMSRTAASLNFEK